MGAAPEGVIEDPGLPGPLLEADHRGDGVGHRAEVDGDVLGLHDQLAGGVEEGGRAVVALLDVRRIRRADQRRSHLVAGRAQAADHHLQGDRVERAHPARPWADSATIVPLSSTSPPPTGRDDEGRLGKLEDDRPLEAQARLRLATQHGGLDPLAGEPHPTLTPSSLPAAGRRGSRARAGATIARRMWTRTTWPSGSRWP